MDSNFIIGCFKWFNETEMVFSIALGSHLISLKMYLGPMTTNVSTPISLKCRLIQLPPKNNICSIMKLQLLDVT